MFHLSEIWVYPVKSLGGFSIPKAKVEARGLQFDRRWMVVNELGEMLTQREFPKMATIETEISADLRLTCGQMSVVVPLETQGKRKTVKIWHDRVKARDCGDQASDFLSETLKTNARLVWMDLQATRPLDPTFAGEGETVSFADGFPFLILGESTLADLNDRILEKGGEAVPMSRFRPNFVFAGGTPLDEESWHKFSIGAIDFEAVKPCSRCVITTIDQESGVKFGPDPIRTLASYRKMGAAVYLGQNVVARSFGEVSVGAKIEVHTRK